MEGQKEPNEAATSCSLPVDPIPEPKEVKPCTVNVCLNGHESRPQMALVDCPECKGQTLMVRMVNCPYCNEPINKLRLRADFVPKGAGVVKRCLGQKVYGESLDIEIERHLYKEVEAKNESH